MAPAHRAGVRMPTALGVHVWVGGLDRDPHANRWMHRMIHAGDRERAARFRFERDQRRYLVSHALLRSVLALYLGIEPADVPLEAAPSGKPELGGPAAAAGLRFNLSHSDEVAVLAVTRRRAIGVDLERVRPLAYLELIAKHFFSAAENAALGELPADARTRAFFTCWTRKEAYLKATGEGLSFPTTRFEVTVAPDQPARLLRIDGDPAPARKWSMKTFSPVPGHVCTVVVLGRGVRLTCRRWPDALA